jgi:hypothetical protein
MASYTAQQLADIRAARATGAIQVDTPNMKTTFRSLDEMDRIIASMAADVEGATRTRTSYATFSKD